MVRPKLAARTYDTLLDGVADALRAITPRDASSFQRLRVRPLSALARQAADQHMENRARRRAFVLRSLGVRSRFAQSVRGRRGREHGLGRSRSRFARSVRGRRGREHGLGRSRPRTRRSRSAARGSLPRIGSSALETRAASPERRRSLLADDRIVSQDAGNASRVDVGAFREAARTSREWVRTRLEVTHTSRGDDPHVRARERPSRGAVRRIAHHAQPHPPRSDENAEAYAPPPTPSRRPPTSSPRAAGARTPFPPSLRRYGTHAAPGPALVAFSDVVAALP